MASEDALLVVDATGVVVEWSEAARALFDRTGDETLGRPVAALLSGAWDEGGDATRPDAPGAGAGLLVRPVKRQDGTAAWGLFRSAVAGREGDGIGGALLEALFTLSPIGMQILDPDLRILRVNTATSDVAGLDERQLVGRRMSDVFRMTDPQGTEAMARRVLATGEPVLDRVVAVRPPTAPEHECLYSTSVFRLQSTDGHVLGAATAVVDVTDRERALSRTRLLNAAREQVGRTLGMETTCAQLVSILVPAFADDAEVDLVDPVIRGEEPPATPVGPDVPLRRMAFASTDRQRDTLGAGAGPFRFPAAWTRVLTDLQPRLVTYRGNGPGPVHDAPAGSHSALVIPMTWQDGVLGTLSLYRSADREVFEQEDLDLALELAARTALHLDNARRYTREHTIALTLQRRLLPRHPPAQAAVESSRFHVPAGAGGGWFDIIPLSGARVALTVGHVSGRGIQTTTAMGQLRTAIHTLSSLDLEPDELLARLNDTVARLAAERVALPAADPVRGQVLTAGCLYGVYDPLTLSCTFARAGHPPPVLAYPDGTTEVPDLPAGPPLGSDEGAPFAATRLSLAEGSVIALHTDVFLPPGEAGTHDGHKRLRQILASPGRPLDELRDEAVQTVPPMPPDVDAILLLVRTHALAEDAVATWELPADPAAVAVARARTHDKMEQWGLSDLSFATELIVSELATNALRHGTPPLRLRLIKERNLICEVTDSSPVAPHLRHARTSDEGGRGLFICAELAQRWGVRYTAGGKTIWTEQALPGDHRMS